MATSAKIPDRARDRRPKLLPIADRERRVESANEFIAVIASHGRRFFRHEGRVARFLLNGGHLYFRDAYSERLIYVAYRKGPWRGFSNGGTLRSLIENLADWIRHGTPLWADFFEPMLDGRCRWGYGEPAMQAVREAAAKLSGRG